MSARESALEVDLVVPDMFDAHGGIARMSRALALALARTLDARGGRLTVHALMDGGALRDARYLPVPHDYRAYRGNRARLTVALLGRAWRSPRPERRHLLILAHPNLAVPGLAFPPWVRTIAVVYGLDVRTRLRWERRLALRRSGTVWAISADTRELAITLQGVRATCVEVIHLGLDPHWPVPPVPPRGMRHLLAVSRLHPAHAYKGIDVTIEALARIPLAERPPLVVAGDGPDRLRLEALARRLVVDTTFTGNVDDDDLAALARDAIAFVLPSTGEGFGLVYLEAMAFALPCIGARAGGAPEVIADEETGILIPPRDVDALVAAMRRVISDEGRIMGLAGRARLEREFTFEAFARRVRAALERY